MNKTIIYFLTLSLVAIGISPAFAQSTSADAEIQAVRVAPAVTSEVTNMELQVDSKESTSSANSPVGGDGEDIGAPSQAETTGIEHEDIGVIKNSDEETSASKIDLIKSVSTESRSGGFLKIGDIKGESTDTSDTKNDNDGVLDNNDTENTAAKASKPKEIVVVGSKVRGWDPEKKEEIINAAPADASLVYNETDLALLTARLVTENADVPTENVTLNFEKITWEYKQQGKLFGFIPFSVLQKLEVETEDDSFGHIKVKMPWWHVFVKKHVSTTAIEQMWEDELQTIGDDSQLTNIDLQNALQKQAQILQMMSNVSKMLHDTAMAVIRKIG